MARFHAENDSPIIAVASNSPRRIAATNQLVSPDTVEYVPGGSENELLPVHQIARSKILFALPLLIDRHPQRRGIVLAADVKVAPMLHGGLELKSKPQNESEALAVLKGMIHVAKMNRHAPYYIVNAGFAKWEGDFDHPRRNSIETRTEFAGVILNAEKLDRISTSKGFAEYKDAIAKTELSPTNQQTQTQVTDVSGGLSLAALAHLGVVDALIIGDNQIARSTEGSEEINHIFIAAFKMVYFMQAVGFSPELLNRRQGSYSSVGDILTHWDWLNDITQRVFYQNIHTAN